MKTDTAADAKGFIDGFGACFFVNRNAIAGAGFDTGRISTLLAGVRQKPADLLKPERLYSGQGQTELVVVLE